jgi:hypothetical protein
MLLGAIPKELEVSELKQRDQLTYWKKNGQSRIATGVYGPHLLVSDSFVLQ